MSETCRMRLAGNTGLKNDAKNLHLRTIAQLCRAISSQLRHALTIGKKNLLSSNISLTCPYNMVNSDPLATEIVSLVWDTPANFNGFRVLAALCTAKLRRWTEGTTCIRQGGHHVGHWPTFLVGFCFTHIHMHMRADRQELLLLSNHTFHQHPTGHSRNKTVYWF